MIYATSVVTSQFLIQADKSAEALETEVENLARHRAKVERAVRRDAPGRLGPPPGEKSFGDVVVVMVDPGKGEDLRQEIAQLLDR